MKKLSTALLAAGLVALSACGGGASENVAADNAGEELYNLTEEDLATDNLSGNEAGNEADANASTGSSDNAASENAGNSQ